MGVPLYVICPFVLAVFYILSLSLIVIILITVCLGAFFLGFILPGTFCASWTWWLFSHVRKVFSYYFFKYFLKSFLSLFWDPYNVTVGTYNVVPEFSEEVFMFFILLSVFCSVAVIAIILFPRYVSVLLHQLFCYWFLLVYCSPVSVCSLVLDFWWTFLVLSRSFPPFFFWYSGSSSLSCFWIISLEGCLSPFHSVVFRGFVSPFDLGQNSLLFHPGQLSVICFWFSPLRDCGSRFFCLPSVDESKRFV